MAELRGVSYSNGNGAHVSAPVGGTNGESKRHKGYKKSSYELENVVYSSNGKNASENVPAVVVRNACKHFTKGVPVLENLNMTVKRGAIYSLLGSSGCGKTTTLSCIVGVRKLNAGDIYVFGARPGVKGKSVGFMPQDTSLYGDFSIGETLTYFGTLCGMDREATKRGTAFLTQLLSLPDSSRRVGTLSGGQRRRVSFAVALIHDPELLILDEPTVGVDPLLREHIWKHLVRLSTERGTTVLITTHYIDEAKESTTVGVMRYGRLLVEQEPVNLLRRFNTSSLETVVLLLCRKDTKDNEKDEQAEKASKMINGASKELELAELEYDQEMQPDSSKFIPPADDETRNERISDSFTRVKSLIHKNLVVLFRNLLLFFFSVIMPAFIIYVMCIAFNDDPRDLNFGVVNYEFPNLTECLSVEKRIPGECDIENLSCKYLQFIPQETVNFISFENEEDADAAVRSGSIWGYLHFAEDFSTSFFERSSNGANTDDATFNKSDIIVKMDQTSKNIVNRVKKSFHDGFEDYGIAVLEDCGLDRRKGEFTLNYHDPIFGTDDTKFIAFIAPSVTVIWLFFFPIIAASIRFINEKKQGTYDRSLVAGTKTWEILFAYGSTEFIVLILQSLLAFFVLNVLIGIEVLGSSLLALILFVLSGFGGVSMGLFIGSLCNEEIEAALLAMSLFFPNCFVSGMLWPTEGMPVLLQQIAYYLPCTLTCEAMRSLFSRGWSLAHEKVYPGFISIVAYILFYFVLTVLVQRFKRL